MPFEEEKPVTSRTKNSTAQIATGFSRIATFLRAGQWRQAEAARLTPTQSQILIYLAQRGPARLGALAAETGVTQATASDSVNALVRKGLLRKTSDPADARARRLQPTLKGQRAAEELSLWPQQMERALESLSLQEQATVLRALTKIIRDLQTAGAIPVQRMCLTCRYFRPNAHPHSETPHHCAFVDAAFGEAELRLDCGEHEAAETAVAASGWQRFAAENGAE
ncbi:MarR family winged helix-turn-helix transcriptional regulator [Pelagibius sp. CAU 1746]|uniref:MarR family winged helix-turn-helix transcriptional regulator n=1 Tax=Pelagibius sp. CAU 1746 TaxID=3140370 RepID=UPI00325BF563